MRWLEKNAKNIWSYIPDGQLVIIMENEKKLRKVSSHLQLRFKDSSVCLESPTRF